MKNKYSSLAFYRMAFSQSGFFHGAFYGLILVLFLLARNTIALAQPPATPANAQGVESSTSDTRYSRPDDVLQAKSWELKQEDWSRYQQLMRGPLGIYSPGLDPLTALGIEARSDEERRRYAQLQVQAEARRVEKELAYQRAYDEAWQRLYPSLLPVTGMAPEKSTSAVSAQGRLAVFVQENCPACETRVKQLQGEGRAFDVFLVASNNDDALIRRWAAKVGISPDKVRSHAITLNHDNGRWLKLGVNGGLPAVLKEVEGQWRREP